MIGKISAREARVAGLIWQGEVDLPNSSQTA